MEIPQCKEAPFRTHGGQNPKPLTCPKPAAQTRIMSQSRKFSKGANQLRNVNKPAAIPVPTGFKTEKLLSMIKSSPLFIVGMYICWQFRRQNVSQLTLSISVVGRLCALDPLMQSIMELDSSFPHPLTPHIYLFWRIPHVFVRSLFVPTPILLRSSLFMPRVLLKIPLKMRPVKSIFGTN